MTPAPGSRPGGVLRYPVARYKKAGHNQPMNSNHTLPDEQAQIDEDERKDAVDLQTMRRAEDLASQFEEIKDRTLSDGMVLGKLEDIQTSENNDRIVVSIDVPGDGTNHTKRFRKPKVWSNRYKFVRWVRHYDYDADSFPNMLRDDCKVKVNRTDSREYEVYVPDGSWNLGGLAREMKSVPRFLWEQYRENGEPILSLGIGVGLLLFTVAGVFRLMLLDMTAIQFAGLVLILFVLNLSFAGGETIALKGE